MGLASISSEERDTILVLPNTFFNDCLKDYGTGDTSERIKDMTQTTFIAEFFLLRKALYPHLRVASTTKKAYVEFKKTGNGKEINLWDMSSSVLEDAIEINTDSSIDDNLPTEQGLLAIANDMYTEDNLNPIILVRPDAKTKWTNTYYDEFYKTHPNAERGVEIYTVEETLIHLKSKYPILYQQAKDNLLKEEHSASYVRIYV